MATDYGVDCNCVTDLDPSFALVTGQLAVGQCVARGLLTEPGTLLDAPHWGRDLRQYLSEPKSAGALARAKADCERQARMDERVESVEVATSYAADDTLVCSLTLTTADETFTLVLSIDAVTVSVLTS